MGLGVLALQQRPRPRRAAQTGFGALGATIPSTCWDKPGFKDCHGKMWASARDACEGGLAKSDYNGNVSVCIDTEASDRSYYGCALRICPPPVKPSPISSGGWTWGNTTPNASVKTFQTHLNVALEREGYKPIAADGRLGPATCGAFKVVGGIHPTLFTKDPIQNLVICQAWTNPTKVGATKPVADPVSREAAELDREYGGLPWGQPDERVVNLQSQINAQLMGHGMLPIAVSGRLDAPTCGAMRWLDRETGSRWMATWGQHCAGFVEPTPSTKPIVPGTTKPATVAVTTVPDAAAPAEGKKSNALVIGALAALLVGAGIVAQQKGLFG